MPEEDGEKSTSIETKMLSQTDLLFLWSKTWLHVGLCPTQPSEEIYSYDMTSRREQPKWDIHSSPTDACLMEAEKDDFWKVIAKKLHISNSFQTSFNN